MCVHICARLCVISVVRSAEPSNVSEDALKIIAEEEDCSGLEGQRIQTALHDSKESEKKAIEAVQRKGSDDSQDSTRRVDAKMPPNRSSLLQLKLTFHCCVARWLPCARLVRHVKPQKDSEKTTRLPMPTPLMAATASAKRAEPPPMVVKTEKISQDTVLASRVS